MKNIFKHLLLIFGGISMSLTGCNSGSGTSTTPSSSSEIGSPTSVEFDEENIILTAGVISDPHIGYSDTTHDNNDIFKNTLTTLKELNGGKDFDVFLSAGDNTQNGTKNEVETLMTSYNSIYDINRTPFFFAHGNHDTYWSGCMSTTQFYEIFGESVYQKDLDQNAAKLGNRHMVINGIHLVAVQVATYQPGNNVFTAQTMDWVKTTLDAIYAENPLSPVLVLCHSPASNTVHGSFDENDTGVWGSSQTLASMLKDYPNVILFSGHTHYDFYNEKSISSEDFTAIQVPSSSDLDLDVNYAATIKELTNRRDYSFGGILQIDKYGNVKFTRYDLNKKMQILEPWIIPSPKADNSHLLKYSLSLRQATNQAPLFEGKNITLHYDENKRFKLEFEPPIDDDLVLAYRVRVFVGTEEDIYDEDEDYLAEFTYIDDYYNYPQGKEKVLLEIDGVYSRKSQWTVKLYAIDCWGKVSLGYSPTEIIDTGL